MSLKGKLVLIGLGVGVGYILGAKAGRERYDEIAKKASAIWNAPVVKDVRDTAADFVEARLDDVGGLLKIGAASAIDRATGAKKRSRANRSKSGKSSSASSSGSSKSTGSKASSVTASAESE